MKKLTLFIVALLFAALSFAQVKQNAIKINIFGIVTSQYQLAYEKAFSEKVSAQLSVGYISNNWGILDNTFGDFSSTGFVIIPEGRYYFQEGIKGAYVGAFFRYRTITWKYEDLDIITYNTSYTDKRTAVGGGIVLGFQALISNALVLDFFVGPQFKATSNTFEWEDPANIDPFFIIDDSKTENNGIGVRFGVNVGFAF